MDERESEQSQTLPGPTTNGQEEKKSKGERENVKFQCFLGLIHQCILSKLLINQLVIGHRYINGLPSLYN